MGIEEETADGGQVDLAQYEADTGDGDGYFDYRPQMAAQLIYHTIPHGERQNYI